MARRLAPRVSAAALWLAAASLPAWSPAARGADAAGDRAGAALPPEGPITVGLVEGQAIVGKVLDRSLTIRTRYGVLTVPLADVIQVRLSPQLAPESRARLERLLELLEKSGAESPAGGAAVEALEDLGVAAVPALRRALGRYEDDVLRSELEALVDPSRWEDAYVEDLDEIVSVRFTMRGQILEDMLRVQCTSGVIEVPRHDILRITLRELDIRHVWKVGPQYSEQESFLDTKCKVKKGQKFTLTPSGTMTYDGQSFGPGGLPNHTWNSRRVGCLQWRIGGGAWQILESAFQGRAPASGTLQFCVHVFRGGAGGEFTVEFKTRKKQ
jgi:hypothetical protein